MTLRTEDSSETDCTHAHLEDVIGVVTDGGLTEYRVTARDLRTGKIIGEWFDAYPLDTFGSDPAHVKANVLDYLIDNGNI
jgi:hypothetical protein